MKLLTYLINLDGSDERLKRATDILHEQGVVFERVSAFDGRGVDVSNIQDYDENKALAYMGRTLKGGEIGCYFSHLNCAKKFLASDAEFVMVLEDDMQATEDLMIKVDETLDWLESGGIDWYLINIGALKRKIHTPLHKIQHHILSKAHYFPMTTTGVIWSRKGAQFFIDSALPVYAPIDNFFRDWLTDNNKGLSVYPPLVYSSESFESDIDGGRGKRKSIGRTKYYGYAKQKRLWKDKVKALKNKYLND